MKMCCQILYLAYTFWCGELCMCAAMLYIFKLSCKHWLMLSQVLLFFELQYYIPQYAGEIIT